MSSTIRFGRTLRAPLACLLAWPLAALLAWPLAALLAASACGDDAADPPADRKDAAAGSAAGKGGGNGGTRDGGVKDAGPADGGAPAEPEPARCDVQAPARCPTPEPSYEADVEPIIAVCCLSCHDGKGKEWPLTSESHVASWFIQIRDAMVKCTMPPADSGVTMPSEERETILAWLRCKF